MAGSSGAIRAGKAFVELFADNSQLSKGLNEASGMIKSWGASIAAVGAGIAAAGLAAIAFFGSAAKTFADVSSELHDLSERTSLSVESLGERGFAAEVSGASLQDLSTGILRMQRFLTQAAGGNAVAIATLKKLGFTVDELKDLDADEQFQLLGKSIDGMANSAERGSTSMTVLGRGGARLLPMIKNMDALRDRAREMGIVLGKEDVEAGFALHKAFKEVEAVTKGVWTQIGAALAPALTELATNLAAAIAWVVRFVKENRPLVVLAAQIAAGLVVLGAALVAVGVGVVAAGAVLGGLTAVVSAVIAVISALWPALP